MSAKKTGDVAIPRLIAGDAEKSMQYRAGFLFGKKRLPRKELIHWLEALGPEMEALPADFKNRKDIYITSPFMWGYFVACSEEEVHCKQHVGRCSCVRIEETFDHATTFTPREIPKCFFHGREPSSDRRRVIAEPLRAVAVPEEVIERVLEREGDTADSWLHNHAPAGLKPQFV